MNNTTPNPWLLFVALLLTVTLSASGKESKLSKTLHEMNTLTGLSVDGQASVQPNGPVCEKVIRIGSYINGRIDLNALGVNPADYDLLKVEVKSNRGSFARFSLENYPNDGELSHWYWLDSARKAFGWSTIYVDLRRPEEIKPPKGYKGMEAKDLSKRGLRMYGRTFPDHGPMWWGKIRLIKKSVDLDWDQTEFAMTWKDGGDLIYSYPLSVTNRLQEPITVELAMTPFEQTHARAELEHEMITLQPGERRTVNAHVSLPGKIAASKPPLYAERFTVSAEAIGIPDSKVILLRSSDPLHLTVTVPIPEEKLAFPLFKTPLKELPASVVQYREDVARKAMETDVNEMIEATKKKRMRDSRFMELLSSAAFTYVLRDDPKGLEIAKKLLAALPDIYAAHHERFVKKDVRVISSGVFAHAGLSLGWRIGGTQRPPYFYGGRGNAGAGGMTSIAHIFDMLHDQLDEDTRNAIIQGFFLPAAIRARNHYVGPNNMQLTQNVATLYGGLMSRNWPLVAFAMNAEHGFEKLMGTAFGTDGMTVRESEHHTYAVNPVLWAAEILRGVGVDWYDQRLYTIVHSRTALPLKAKYIHQDYATFLDNERFAGKAFMKNLPVYSPDVGEHMDGLTRLKYKGNEIMMNWDLYTFRGCPALNALWIKHGGQSIGGIVEDQGDRSLFGNSAIVVDELYLHPPANRATGCQTEGPVQYIQSTSYEEFDDWQTTRTYAIVDKYLLVVDRVASDQPRTVDWQLRDMAEMPAVEMAKQDGSFCSKKTLYSERVSYGKEIKRFHHASTDAMWQSDKGTITMAAAPGTELFRFDWKKKPMLMVRRRGVTQTDFITAVSPEVASVTQVPVTGKNGKAANAVGVKVALKNGKSFQAIVNYEPNGSEVALGKLKTSARFATDYR